MGGGKAKYQEIARSSSPGIGGEEGPDASGQEIPIEGSGFDSAACLDAQYSVDNIPVAPQRDLLQ